MPATAEASPTQTPAQTTTRPLPATLHRIVLTGFMGAGKSTVGRLLAAELGWEFLDLDASIEARTGHTVPELFALHGEDRFRQLEASALAAALRLPRTVLALGGGAPEHLTSRLLLEQTPGTHTVFLDAPFPTLFDRCMLQSIGAGTSASELRPLLTTPAAAEARFRARHPHYRRLARYTVETAALTPAETASRILADLYT